MSYARLSHSDLYLFMNMQGYLECMGCMLAPITVMAHSTSGASFRTKSTSAMIKHIKEHRMAGHNVPEDIEERLLEDDKDNFK